MIKEIISHVNYLSSFLGFLFGFTLLFRKKNLSIVLLSVFFILVSYFRLLGFSLINFHALPPAAAKVFSVTSAVVIPFNMILPCLIFFYSSSVIGRITGFRPAHLLHLLPFFVFLIIPFFIDFHGKTGSSTPVNPEEAFKIFFTSQFMTVWVVVIITSGLVYTIVSIFHVYKFNRVMKNNFSNINRIKSHWLNIFLISMLANYITRNTGFWTHLAGLTDLNFFITASILGDFSIDFIVFSAVFITFYQPLSFYDLKIADSGGTEPLEEKTNAEKYKAKYEKLTIRDEDINRHLKTLLEYMEREKPFLSNTLTLKDLSDKTGIPAHHLSLIINSKLNRNFYNFINSYRVQYARELIMNRDKQIDSKNLLYIAMESGFNSKTTFNVFFKKHTGLTPSQFRETLTNIPDDSVSL